MRTNRARTVEETDVDARISDCIREGSPNNRICTLDILQVTANPISHVRLPDIKASTHMIGISSKVLSVLFIAAIRGVPSDMQTGAFDPMLCSPARFQRPLNTRQRSDAVAV